MMKRIVATLAFLAMMDFAALEPTSAAPGDTSPSPHICTFLRLSPSACAQMLRVGRRAQGESHVSAPQDATLVYASEPFKSAVRIFSFRSGVFAPAGQLASINGYPIGLTVDALQRLYVAVTTLGGNSGQNAVEVFPRGATKPTKTYTDQITGPVDVAVDSNGTLYVANISNYYCSDLSGDGSIVEYAKGSMKATKVITDIPGCPGALGLDANDNLYVTNTYYGGSPQQDSDVFEYGPGSTKGRELNLQLKPAGPPPAFYRVAVDDNGNLLVASDNYNNTLGQILVYPPGSTSPSRAIEYGANWRMEYFAFQANRFFASSAGGLVKLVPAEFAYPSGQENHVANKLVPPDFYYGFAVSPR